MLCSMQGAPPIAADPGGFRDFRIFLLFKKRWFLNVSGGIWGRGSLRSIGNACGLQIEGFSAQTEPYGFIFNNFDDFGHFGIVFVGLIVLPEGPRTLRECPEGPGTL